MLYMIEFRTAPKIYTLKTKASYPPDSAITAYQFLVNILQKYSLQVSISI